jgi:hypothetical protein
MSDWSVTLVKVACTRAVPVIVSTCSCASCARAGAAATRHASAVALAAPNAISLVVRTHTALEVVRCAAAHAPPR